MESAQVQMSQKPAEQKDSIYHCHLFRTPPSISQEDKKRITVCVGHPPVQILHVNSLIKHLGPVVKTVGSTIH